MLFSLLLAVTIVTSCDDDDPEPVNEEELITTVNVTFTNQADQSVVTATFRDLDGDGGNAPVITNPTLDANANYSVTVEFLDESDANDVEDITEEVEEEGDEHQVFFVVGSGLNFTYTYGDTDGAGNPLGLIGTGATGAAGSGNLNIVLRHEPTKPNTGLSDAGGETDIDVTFNVTIQ